eukprot:s5127_g8.t1
MFLPIEGRFVGQSSNCRRQDASLWRRNARGCATMPQLLDVLKGRHQGISFQRTSLPKSKFDMNIRILRHHCLHLDLTPFDSLCHVLSHFHGLREEHITNSEGLVVPPEVRDQLILINIGEDNLTDQDYYDEGEDQDPDTDVFDVDEFDEIYASYADAKARLNAVRTSRGFFPVIALVDKGLKGAEGDGDEVMLVAEVFAMDQADADKEEPQGPGWRAFILLPAVLGGKKVKVLTYLIDGTAPPLGGQHDAMAWLSLAKEGEHLLNLVEDKAVLVDKGEADAIYVPDDFENHIDHQNPLTSQSIPCLFRLIMPPPTH